MGLIAKALELAREAHQGQTRKYTGEPYIMHPMRVALHMTLWGEEVVAAALLHDVLEDCPEVKAFQIHDAVGARVLQAVRDLTNPSKGLDAPREERKKMDREHYRGQRIGTCTIKAWDRLDNLRDMDGAPDDFKKLYAEESRQLLAVLLSQNLGERLGQRLSAAIEAVEASCRCRSDLARVGADIPDPPDLADGRLL